MTDTNSDADATADATDDQSIPLTTRLADLFVPSFVQRRYAVKFFVSMLIVVLVISMIGAYGFLQAQGAVEASTENDLKGTSELQADSLDEWVDKMQLQTRTVSAGRPQYRSATASVSKTDC